MNRFIIAFIILSLLFISAEAAYSSFPDNTIPTLAMRIRGLDLSLRNITLELLCELSWLNFDAVNFAGIASNDNFIILMSLCDSLGVYYSICPEAIMQYFKAWADPEYRYWFRNSDFLITSDSCFARCNAEFNSIVQYTSAVIMHHADTAFSIKTTVVNELAYTTFGHDFLWYYEVYDEAPSKQWLHAVRNDYPWDDYIPNVYTQDTLSGDTLSLEEVETSGIFSWQKYLAENNEENEVPFTLNYGLLHTIEQDEYTGLEGDIVYGTMADQATSVRAMMEAEYQGPPDGHDIPLPVDNPPDFISFDYYPFRYVHPDSALA
ncbi:MAG: hypothetical protein KAT09_05615, partial [Candidatus Aegiribacteria sp.]|nr:hypothetical protein [Candidatus Aegiribacteria sp.]